VYGFAFDGFSAAKMQFDDFLSFLFFFLVPTVYFFDASFFFVSLSLVSLWSHEMRRQSSRGDNRLEHIIVMPSF